jgi:hypothetical protein
MDSLEDIVSLPAHPNYVRDVVPDEPTFIDVPRLRFVVTQEEVLSSSLHKGSSPVDGEWDPEQRPTSTKIIQFIEEERRSGSWISSSDREIGESIRALRHVVCRPIPLEGGQATFIGVRELWWPTYTAFRLGIASAPEAWIDLLTRPVRGITVLAQAERFK